MIKKLQALRQDRIFSLAARFFILTTIADLIVILVKWPQFPPQVPLFYSLPWGKQQLTSPSFLLLLPLTSSAIFFINTLLATLFFEEEPLIARLLTIMAAFISFLSIFTLLKIVFLIT